jgi:SAM-dependent methyltransferase
MQGLDEISRKLNSVPWFHRFEILPGIFTPGRQLTDPKGMFAHFGLPGDLTGKRVLDVATLDGAMAFEAEARGATVTALDIQDPSKTGFNTAKEILNSRVTYVEGSVYDATRLLSDRFDYIFCLGLFYHLKNPVLGFEQVSQLLKAHGLLLFEGECLRFYCEDENGLRVDEECIRRLADSNVPIALFYANSYLRDPSNWFIPSFTCLKGWLEAAGLSVVRYSFHEMPEHSPPLQRITGSAKRVGPPRLEHGRIG